MEVKLGCVRVWLRLADELHAVDAGLRQGGDVRHLRNVLDFNGRLVAGVVLLEVGSQVTREREVLVADLALVRLVAGVDEHVILEVGGLAEAAITDVALEGPAAVVHVHVRLEVAGRRKAFRAQAALVRLFLVVRHFVVV